MPHWIYHHPAVYALAARDPDFIRSRDPQWVARVQNALERDPLLITNYEARVALDAFIDSQPEGGSFFYQADQVLPSDWAKHHLERARTAVQIHRFNNFAEISRRFRPPLEAQARQMARRIGFEPDLQGQEGDFVHPTGLRVYLQYHKNKKDLKLLVRFRLPHGNEEARRYMEETARPLLKELDSECLICESEPEAYVQPEHPQSRIVKEAVNWRAHAEWRNAKNRIIERFADDLQLTPADYSDLASRFFRRYVHSGTGLQFNFTVDDPVSMETWTVFPESISLKLSILLRHPRYNGPTAGFLETDLLSALYSLDPLVQSVQVVQDDPNGTHHRAPLRPSINVRRDPQTGIWEFSSLASQEARFRWALWHHPVLWGRLTNPERAFNAARVRDSAAEAEFWVLYDITGKVSLHIRPIGGDPPKMNPGDRLAEFDLQTGRFLREVLIDADGAPERESAGGVPDPWAFDPPIQVTALHRRAAARNGWNLTREDEQGRFWVRHRITGEYAYLVVCGNTVGVRIQSDASEGPPQRVADEYFPLSPIPGQLLDTRISPMALPTAVKRWGWQEADFLHSVDWGRLREMRDCRLRELIEFLRLTASEEEEAYEFATLNRIPTVQQMLACLLIIKAQNLKSEGMPVEHLLADLPHALALFTEEVKNFGTAGTAILRGFQFLRLAKKSPVIAPFTPPELFAARLIGARGSILVREHALIRNLAQPSLTDYTSEDISEIARLLSADSPAALARVERAIGRLNGPAPLPAALLDIAADMDPDAIQKAQGVFTRLGRLDDPLLAATCLILSADAPEDAFLFPEQVMNETVSFVEVQQAIRDLGYDELPEIAHAPLQVGVRDIIDLYGIRKEEAWIAANHPLTKNGLRPAEGAFEAIMLLLDVRHRRAIGQIAPLIPKKKPAGVSLEGLDGRSLSRLHQNQSASRRSNTTGRRALSRLSNRFKKI